MDITERQSRHSLADSLRPALANQGVVAVSTTFVDNAGITRVKSVPLDRLPQLAAWGAGFSPSFDYFRFDDWMAAPPGGLAPVGDLRLMPDLQRVVPLVAQPGWAWASADRYRQDGEPHENCSRQLLRRLTMSLAQQGLAIKAGFEIEWVLAADDSENFKPAVEGAGYGMSRLIAASAYGRDLIDALVRQGIAVEQVPSRGRCRAARALRGGRVARRRRRHVGAGSQHDPRRRQSARLSDLPLAESGPDRSRQRGTPAPECLARRSKPHGRGRGPLRAH